MMKRIAGGILILLLSLLLTGAAREKPMTLMVYMTGSDLESRGGAASVLRINWKRCKPMRRRLNSII